MRLKTVIRRLRGDLSTRDFARALDVSHTAVVEWESGSGVGEWSRIKLLAHARAVGADREIIAALESAQPEFRQ